MPVHVTTKPLNAIPMYWNMAEYKTRHYMVTSNISEVLSIVVKFKDIMVTFYQNLITVKTIKNSK